MLDRYIAPNTAEWRLRYIVEDGTAVVLGIEEHCGVPTAIYADARIIHQLLSILSGRFLTYVAHDAVGLTECMAQLESSGFVDDIGAFWVVHNASADLRAIYWSERIPPCFKVPPKGAACAGGASS